ncbi:MAG: hypothetical protein K2P37_09150 [Oscillospiraceae bacterium]|nr:hypothetical protein [Oscillospiraceae bacterium]
MTSALKKIYEEKFYANWQITPEYRALSEKEQELWEQVKPLIGQKMIDRLMDSQSDISYQTNYEWFREGFLLGASLMLELL